MRYPQPSHLVVVGQVILLGEVPAELDNLRGVNGLIGHRVVSDDQHPVLVIDAVTAQPPKLLDSQTRWSLIAYHEIDLNIEVLPWLDLATAAVRRQNFFSHCTGHNLKLLLQTCFSGKLLGHMLFDHRIEHRGQQDRPDHPGDHAFKEYSKVATG